MFLTAKVGWLAMPPTPRRASDGPTRRGRPARSRKLWPVLLALTIHEAILVLVLAIVVGFFVVWGLVVLLFRVFGGKDEWD
jgi:hypothetical protein